MPSIPSDLRSCLLQSDANEQVLGVGAQRFDEVNRADRKNERLAQVVSFRSLHPDLLIVLVSEAIQCVEHALCHIVNINPTSRAMEVVKKHYLR